MSEWTVSVSRDIAAEPMAVWEAISDITRMGEWSTECQECMWLEDADGPEVGAVFLGINRNGDKEWKTKGRITAAVPGQSFHFDGFVGDFTFARWAYDLEAIDGGTRVTESTLDLRPDEVKARSLEISGIEDRDARNRETMEETLARIAAALEG